MNPTETGKYIAKLRKEAGYTQASLADALCVTDKAVSKWERGLSCPDTALLPKLSKLLDAEIEVLISGLTDYHEHQWQGLLLLNAADVSVSTPVYDKPVIDYLLSYFMLVGIRDITIQTREKSYIKSRHFERYGLNISFEALPHDKTMIVTDQSLIFGVNLTRQFQNLMALNEDVIPTLDGKALPVIFARHNGHVETIIAGARRKALCRGMIHFPIKTKKDVNDVAFFVSLYQKHHDIKIADLKEIALKRGLI